MPNIPTFLICSENKTELFEFLSKKLIKDINMDKCSSNIAESNRKKLAKTVDSDAVVIAISVYHCITNLHELRVELGKGKDLKCIRVH